MMANTSALGLLVAGPCSAESEEQIFTVAQALKNDGRVAFLRAGVWKPRTRPGQFEGVGEKALRWLAKAKEQVGLSVCIEVARREHVELAHQYGIRSFWIGARTTSDPFAVQEIAETLEKGDGPVFVKNPISPDLELWVGAMERIAAHLQKEVIAVLRGCYPTRKITYRNAPEWELALRLRSRFGNALRILCDPSHIAGRQQYVAEVAQQALDYNLDGLMVEVHPTPQCALSDAQQQLTPADFFLLLDALRPSIRGLHEPNCQLENYRLQIDQIDARILDLLGERARVVRSIGEWKFQRGVQAFHEERWRELLKHHLRYGVREGLDSHFIRQLCELVHTESLRIQAKQAEQLRKKQDKEDV